MKAHESKIVISLGDCPQGWFLICHDLWGKTRLLVDRAIWEKKIWPPGFFPWWPSLLNLRLVFVIYWTYLNRMKRFHKAKGERCYVSLWSAWPVRESVINLKVDKARIIVVGWSNTDSHDGNRKDNKWLQSTSDSFGVLWFYGDC